LCLVSINETGARVIMKKVMILILILAILLTGACSKQVTDSQCDVIIDENDRNKCYEGEKGREIINEAIAKKDSSKCAVLKLSHLKDGCYRNVAIEKKDPNFCEKVVGENSKDSCYSDVAWATFDPKICEKVSKEVSKEACYYHLGLKSRDSIKCEGIPLTKYRDQCLSGVSSGSLDENICAKMTDELLKNSCYKSVTGSKDHLIRQEAIEKKDITICDEISVDL